MNIALFGGTHGNEPVGLEVMGFFQESTERFTNTFQCFWSNPKAFAQKKRYIDSDLNRAVGPNANPQGYEKKRMEELKKQVSGQFDFAIDLHTTTTNMGLTCILSNTESQSRQAAAHLQAHIPGLQVIEEDSLDHGSVHLNRLCPAGLIIEVGPVAHNVLNADLVFKTKEIVETVLNFNFSEKPYKKLELYKVIGQKFFPEGSWYIHPELEGSDLQPLRKGAPIFINKDKKIINWEAEEVYPFFINEAAYQEHNSAFIYGVKDTVDLSD